MLRRFASRHPTTSAALLPVASRTSPALTTTTSHHQGRSISSHALHREFAKRIHRRGGGIPNDELLRILRLKKVGDGEGAPADKYNNDDGDVDPSESRVELLSSLLLMGNAPAKSGALVQNVVDHCSPAAAVTLDGDGAAHVRTTIRITWLDWLQQAAKSSSIGADTAAAEVGVAIARVLDTANEALQADHQLLLNTYMAALCFRLDPQLVERARDAFTSAIQKLDSPSQFSQVALQWACLLSNLSAMHPEPEHTALLASSAAAIDSSARLAGKLVHEFLDANFASCHSLSDAEFTATIELALASALLPDPANVSSETSATMWPGSFFHTVDDCLDDPSKLPLPSTRFIAELNTPKSTARHRLQSGELIEKLFKKPISQLMMGLADTAVLPTENDARARHEVAGGAGGTASTLSLMDKMLSQRGLLKDGTGNSDNNTVTSTGNSSTVPPLLREQVAHLHGAAALWRQLIDQRTLVLFESSSWGRSIRALRLYPELFEGQFFRAVGDEAPVVALAKEWASSETHINRVMLLLKQLSITLLRAETASTTRANRMSIATKVFAVFVESPHCTSTALEKLPPVLNTISYCVEFGAEPSMLETWSSLLQTTIDALLARAAREDVARPLAALCAEVLVSRANVPSLTKALQHVLDSNDELAKRYLCSGHPVLHNASDAVIVLFNIARDLCGGTFDAHSIDRAIQSGYISRSGLMGVLRGCGALTRTREEVANVLLLLLPHIEGHWSADKLKINFCITTSLAMTGRKSSTTENMITLGLRTLQLAASNAGDSPTAFDRSVVRAMMQVTAVVSVRCFNDGRIAPLSGIMFAQVLSVLSEVLERKGLLTPARTQWFTANSSIPLKQLLTWCDEGHLKISADTRRQLETILVNVSVDNDKLHTIAANIEAFSPANGELQKSVSENLIDLMKSAKELPGTSIDAIPPQTVVKLLSLLNHVYVPAILADAPLPREDTNDTESLVLHCQRVMILLQKGCAALTISRKEHERLSEQGERAVKDTVKSLFAIVLYANDRNLLRINSGLSGSIVTRLLIGISKRDNTNHLCYLFTPTKRSHTLLLEPEALRCLTFTNKWGVPTRNAHAMIAAICSKCSAPSHFEAALRGLLHNSQRGPPASVGGGVKCLIEYVLPTLAGIAEPSPALHVAAMHPDKVTERQLQELHSGAECERLMTATKTDIVLFLALLQSDEIAGPDADLFAKTINVILRVRRDVCGEPPRAKTMRDRFKGSTQRREKTTTTETPTNTASAPEVDTLHSTLVAMTSANFVPQESSSPKQKQAARQQRHAAMHSLDRISIGHLSPLLHASTRPWLKSPLLTTATHRHAHALVREVCLRRTMQIAPTLTSANKIATLLEALKATCPQWKKGYDKPREVEVVAKALMRRAIELAEGINCVDGEDSHGRSNGIARRATDEGDDDVDDDGFHQDDGTTS